MKSIIVTLKQLKELNACSEGQTWFKEHKIRALTPLIAALIKDNRTSYARWLLARLLTHPQRVMWSIFSAEQVINLFEKKYPNDPRPRLAIQSAKDFLAGKADAAANAAYAAANAADAAANAADAAANAAYAAANAADAAANAAANAADAAANAADAAANAADAARKDMQKQVLNFALQLLGQETI